jgi:TonB family protein
MRRNTLQLGIAAGLAFALTAGWWAQCRANARLREELASLRRENAALAALRGEKTRLGRLTAELDDLGRDDAELKRLNDEAAALRAKMQAVARLEQARAAAEKVYDLAAVDQRPGARFQSRPQYPAELRRLGVTGTVVVGFVVDDQGEVKDVRAVKATLDEKSVAAMKQQEPFTVAATAPTGTSAAPSTLNPEEATRLLEAAAVDAISKWKYAAGRKDGREVKTRVVMPIVFSLGSPQPAAGGK